MSLAIVFPGQGSQSTGMLSEFYETEPLVKSVFAEASERLGYDLWDLVQNGPDEELDRTENTQPAILAASVAIWRIWLESGGQMPEVVAGHSLGEYSALVAAGVMDFGDAVLLVRDRGRFMQHAVPSGVGGMAAILGLDDEVVMDICGKESDPEVVSVANFNAPGQVVIAGHLQAVARASSLAKAAGARKVIPLDVSVPSHCALMKDMAEDFSYRLKEVSIRDASIPVLQNVDAEIHTEASEIHIALVEQLFQPVRWTESVIRMKSMGICNILECGPGKVLTGLNKRIDRELNILPLPDPESLNKALTAETVWL